MERKRSLKCLIIALIPVVIGIMLSGCGTVQWHLMELNLDRPNPSQIHNIKYIPDDKSEPELQRQVEDFMSYYFDSHAEEMGYYTVNFTYREEPKLGWLMISAVTLFIPNLIGMPISNSDYRLYAYLRIYDSRGDLVQTFQKAKYFKGYSGLYYPTKANITKKFGDTYSQLLPDLLKQADRDTRTINAMLDAAGPVTIENAAVARTKIRGTVMTSTFER